MQADEPPKGSESCHLPPSSTSRGDRDPSERLAYDTVIVWPARGRRRTYSELLGNAEKTDGAELRSVSEKTSSFLRNTFNNIERTEPHIQKMETQVRDA